MTMITKIIKSMILLEIPLFVSLFTVNVNELLYFVKLVEKSVAAENLKNAYVHVIRTDELYIKLNYLKTIRSCSINHKQVRVVPTTVVFKPGEVYNTYVNIDENLQININICNASLLKAKN